MGLKDAFLPQPPSYSKKKNYKFKEDLGRGTFGRVVHASWKAAPPPGLPEREVAIKIMLKKAIKGKEQDVMNEMNVLKGLEHENIVRLWEYFESKDKYYLVFDLATGGELFNRITKKGKFSEKDAQDVVRSILSAVCYLHDHDIVHRDLKPENILYHDREEHSKIVLADFGIAKHLSSPDEVLHAAAGSIGYAAPEVLTNAGHGKPVDLWSLGIITFVLLCGYSPFRSDDANELMEETIRGRIEFHERYWKKPSEQSKEFIKLLLNTDPAKRPTAHEAAKHPWLTEHSAEDHDIGEGLRENFSAKGRWNSAITKVRAANSFKTAGLERERRSRQSSIREQGSDASSAVGQYNDTDDEEGYATADEESGASSPKKKSGEKGGGLDGIEEKTAALQV